MKELIDFIEKNLKRERLEAVSTAVIGAYKCGDAITLRTYAEALDILPAENNKRLFYSLIQRLHPDKYPVVYQDFQSAAAAGDKEKLKKIRDLIEVKKVAENVRAERFEYKHTETWEAPSDAYSYEEYDADADVFEDYSSTGGFIEAVKDLIFGNHDFHIEPADLAQIDDGLDVAFCDLEDLEGIEYCRNVRVLNISGNDISNIFDLQELTQLEELYAAGNAIREIEALKGLEYLEIIDISGNDIDDISPLLEISRLKFADIRNNPVHDSRVIHELENNGVIVLH